jgi:hypothetical protein
MAKFIPGKSTLDSLYGTTAQVENERVEALADRGKHWNSNPNPAADSLYGVSENAKAEAEADRIAKFKQDNPEGYARWEADQLRKKTEAKAAADAEWQSKYDAANEAQRVRDEETRQRALEWEAKNRSRIFGR